MEYKISDKVASVTITAKDVDEKVTKENVYNYMPKEVQDFRNKNKDKPNFKETYINGRTSPYLQSSEGISWDAVTYYFELE